MIADALVEAIRPQRQTTSSYLYSYSYAYWYFRSNKSQSWCSEFCYFKRPFKAKDYYLLFVLGTKRLATLMFFSSTLQKVKVRGSKLILPWTPSNEYGIEYSFKLVPTVRDEYGTSTSASTRYYYLVQVRARTRTYTSSNNILLFCSSQQQQKHYCTV